MLTSILLITAVLSSPPPYANPADSNVEPAAAPSSDLKGYHEYSREMKTALRAEALAQKQVERGNAILALTNLYAQLRLDSRFDSSKTLQGMKNKLWARLTHIRDDLQRGLARQREAERKAELRSRARSANPTSNKTPPTAAGRNAARGGRAIVGNFGQALVDLIEHTIAPDKWDTNGGPFSIIYFARKKALVVRATDDFHHDLGGVLNKLRAAGP